MHFINNYKIREMNIDFCTLKFILQRKQIE